MNQALLISCNTCKYWAECLPKGYCLNAKVFTNYNDICNKFGGHFERMDE